MRTGPGCRSPWPRGSDRPVRILVTNDDSIEAEGLHVLVRACEAVGEVSVMAAHHDRSASGHAITLHKPLRVSPARIPGSSAAAWAATGTSADCVLLAVYGLLPARPDVVLCGVNLGSNVGHDPPTREPFPVLWRPPSWESLPSRSPWTLNTTPTARGPRPSRPPWPRRWSVGDSLRMLS
ncbi:MAG: hypothetical protein C4304_00520 [candidate division GAL15 bacterium]